MIWFIFFSCHLSIWWPQCTSIWADWAILFGFAWISEWKWAECSFYSLQIWQGKEHIPLIEPLLLMREKTMIAKNFFCRNLIMASLEPLWLSGIVSPSEESKGWGSTPRGNWECFLWSMLVTTHTHTQNVSLYLCQAFFMHTLLKWKMEYPFSVIMRLMLLWILQEAYCN